MSVVAKQNVLASWYRSAELWRMINYRGYG